MIEAFTLCVCLVYTYVYEVCACILFPQGDHSSFIHVDSEETDQYSFDTAFLQSAECLETYVYNMYDNCDHVILL